MSNNLPKKINESSMTSQEKDLLNLSLSLFELMMSLNAFVIDDDGNVVCNNNIGKTKHYGTQEPYNMPGVEGQIYFYIDPEYN